MKYKRASDAHSASTKASSIPPSIYDAVIYPLIVSGMDMKEISDKTQVKEYAIRNSIKRAINTNVSKRVSRLSNQKVAIIETWVDTQESLDSIAKRFYVSEGHVSKLIREYLGVKEGEVISLMSKI